MRTLRSLVEARRDLVPDRTRLTNRITAALKAYLPQIPEWFRDKDATIFADFLERWPTLQAAQRARRETLESFFRAGNVRYKKTIELRIDAIRNETPLHSDDAVITPSQLLVEAWLSQLRVLSAGIARFDAEIASLAPQLPETTSSSPLCRAPVPPWPGDCLRRSGSGVSGFPMPRLCKTTPASRQSSSAAATNAGYTGAIPARNSCDKPSSSGSARPSLARSGQKYSTRPAVPAVAATKPLCAL